MSRPSIPDPREESYLAPDTALLMSEFSEGKEIGEPCGIPELDKIFTWKRGFLNVFTGWANAGKALSIDTKIPSPDGFKTMGEIKIGDYVFDESGNPCRVVYATDVMKHRKCFMVKFSDGSEVIADADHLWFTYTHEARKSEFMAKDRKRAIIKPTVDQSYKRIMPGIRTTDEISKSLRARGGTHWNHSVKTTAPVKGFYRDLPIPPYILGVWLGDGNSDSGGLTCADPQIISEIEKEGFDCSMQNTKYRYSIRALIGKLRDIGLLKNKHIPVDYLFSSYSQRLDLIQGLMDTDGTILKSGVCEFSVINESLARGFHTLICSMGVKATFLVNDAKLYGRIISKRYRVAFKTTLPVFRLNRKFDRIPIKLENGQRHRYIIGCDEIKSVPVRCIQVDSPSKLYLCSESFIPTHNTTFLLHTMLVRSLKYGTKWNLWSPEQIGSRREGDKVYINANDIYDELIHMYTGKVPYKHWTEKFGKPQMPLDEYLAALEVIRRYFFVMHPKDRHYKNIIDNHRYFREYHGCDGFVNDPFKNLILDDLGRDDKTLERTFSDFEEFAMNEHVFMNFVAHPRAMTDVKERPKGNAPAPYKVCTQFFLLGGSAWDNSMDGIFSIYRQNAHLDPQDPMVTFITLKQRKQQLTHRKGEYANIEFDFFSNRFYFGGTCPLDGSIKNPKPQQTTMPFTNHWDKKNKKKATNNHTDAFHSITVDDSPPPF